MMVMLLVLCPLQVRVDLVVYACRVVLLKSLVLLCLGIRMYVLVLWMLVLQW